MHLRKKFTGMANKVEMEQQFNKLVSCENEMDKMYQKMYGLASLNKAQNKEMDKRINERNPEQFGKLEEQIDEVKNEYRQIKEEFQDQKQINDNTNVQLYELQ